MTHKQKKMRIRKGGIKKSRDKEKRNEKHKYNQKGLAKRTVMQNGKALKTDE